MDQLQYLSIFEGNADAVPGGRWKVLFRETGAFLRPPDVENKNFESAFKVLI